ncbi:hypothetical protein LCGC14_1351160 [marine sediment metagenome]|uniref:Uncharacterized protein n=1 Tax=marine sediment metagenome TaxID=412755 RepID=A0A0F9KBM1_9ZZZZ
MKIKAKNLLKKSFAKLGRLVTNRVGYIVIRILFVYSTLHIIFIAFLFGEYLAVFEGVVVLALFLFLTLKEHVISEYQKLTNEQREFIDEMQSTLELAAKQIKTCEKKSAASLRSVQALEKNRLEKENETRVTKKKRPGQTHP